MLAASDWTGFVASALVLITFTMKDMRLLRITAIFSNIAFIVYAEGHQLVPVLGLHIALLPLNLFRLMQVQTSAPPGSRTQSRRYWSTEKATQLAIEELYLADVMRVRQILPPMAVRAFGVHQ
jgi:hypothetical protein